LKLVVCLAVSCGSLACGPYPPSVSDRGDIESLSTDTPSLHARSLRDEDIPALQRLANLEYLDFESGWARNDITTGFKPWRAPLTDCGLALLSTLALPKLETLGLGHCASITDAGMEHVAKMTQVRTLILHSTAISDRGLETIASMPGLTYLSLADCPGVTDRGLEILARKQNWTTLMVRLCPHVTEAGLERLQSALPDCFVN
jgi:hypothetical protein